MGGTVDGNRFDQLVVALSTAGTRRGIMRLLGTLPFAGGLAMLLGEDETAAAGRHRRPKKPHKHRRHTGNHAGKQKSKSKHQHTGCQPESPAETCAGKCGPVKNTCKKTVHCGSCACDPPCPVCQICDKESRSCQPDPNTEGDTCGAPGQVCQSDGRCACNVSSCPACRTCQGNGLCSAGCNGSGCCDGTTCQPGTSDVACGTGGDACAVCTGGEACDGGSCRCTAIDPCTSGVCGIVQNVCGDEVDCGSCGGTTPICRQHLCTACSDSNPCPDGCCAADGSCQNGTSHAACGPAGQACDVCTEQETCQARQCVCNPDCGGKICGPDGCGNQCGPGCPPNASCSDDGTACTCDFLTCNSICCAQANAICHASTGACCVPESMAQTCNGQCGDVINNCGIHVNCGPCTCSPTCPACKVCDAATGDCITDPIQQGNACGDGQICQADGTCACSGSSCGACRTCAGDGSCEACAGCCAAGQCVASCGDCQVCQGGQCVSCPDCCDGNGDCQPGTTDGACGSSGACVDCTAANLACVNSVCACTAGSCTTGCCQGGACHIGDDAACGANGGICVDCGAGRRCLNGQCVCDGTSCPNGCCDAQGQCQVNTDIICGFGGAPCETCNPCTQFCVEGTCQDFGGTCDCSNLNFCSQHGCCTPFCSCICEAPWTGPECADLPPVICSDFGTCAECINHAADGCVFCESTLGGEHHVCVGAADCLIPLETCCPTYTTCAECLAHATDGCVFCAETFGGESNVCVAAFECNVQVGSCP